MIKLQETTKWTSPQDNHIYFVSDAKDKLIAFQAANSDSVKTFSKPLMFNTRGRTFVKLK